MKCRFKASADPYTCYPILNMAAASMYTESWAVGVEPIPAIECRCICGHYQTSHYGTSKLIPIIFYIRSHFMADGVTPVPLAVAMKVAQTWHNIGFVQYE